MNKWLHDIDDAMKKEKVQVASGIAMNSQLETYKVIQLNMLLFNTFIEHSLVADEVAKISTKPQAETEICHWQSGIVF